MSSLSKEEYLLLLERQTKLYQELARMEREFNKKKNEKLAELLALNVDQVQRDNAAAANSETKTASEPD